MTREGRGWGEGWGLRLGGGWGQWGCAETGGKVGVLENGLCLSTLQSSRKWLTFHMLLEGKENYIGYASVA